MHGDTGARRPAKVLGPQLPTKEEVEEHNLTRLPFRNLCQHCVHGAGRAADHRVHLRDDGLPESYMDYCFRGTDGKSTESVVVVRERLRHMTMSTIA